MKLVQPWTVGPLARLGAATVLEWLGSLRFTYLYDDPAFGPQNITAPAIYLFWHEMMLFPAYSHSRQRFAVLSSLHSDGELMARLLGHLGFSVIRGSTRKRGMSALRGLMRTSKVNHIAITPDGPRGPRRVVQHGSIFLASRTGMPILPAGFAFEHCWRLNNWDRTALPKPCSRAVGLLGTPIIVPPELNSEGIEQYRLKVQSAMDDVQSRAEAEVGYVCPPRRDPKGKFNHE